MNLKEIQKLMIVLRKHGLRSYINHNFELIVEPKYNIYFRLEDVKVELDLKCKVLEWLSRPSCKGVSLYFQKRIKAAVNEYLGTDFTFSQIEEIYTRLGNGCNRPKTIRFISSDYNFNVLTEQSEDYERE